MKPSIGRIVHYLFVDEYGEESVAAAIITKVWSDTVVNLIVFHDGATGYANSVLLEADGIRCGRWAWPPRV